MASSSRRGRPPAELVTPEGGLVVTTMRRARRQLTLVVIVAVALAACGSDPNDAVPAQSGPTTTGTTALEGTTWELNAQGFDLRGLDQARPTLLLDAGRASGFAGCNRYTGAYTLASPSLSFGTVGSTSMACGAVETAIEHAYLDRLAKVSKFVLTAPGLQLQDSTGATVLTFAPANTSLVGSWMVTGYLTSSGSAFTSVDRPANQRPSSPATAPSRARPAATTTTGLSRRVLTMRSRSGHWPRPCGRARHVAVDAGDVVHPSHGSVGQGRSDEHRGDVPERGRHAHRLHDPIAVALRTSSPPTTGTVAAGEGLGTLDVLHGLDRDVQVVQLLEDAHQRRLVGDQERERAPVLVDRVGAEAIRQRCTQRASARPKSTTSYAIRPPMQGSYDEADLPDTPALGVLVTGGEGAVRG